MAFMSIPQRTNQKNHKMKELTILHIIPSLSLVGGTIAKVYTLVSYSKFKHIIYYYHGIANKNYIEQWKQNKNCLLIEGINKKNYIRNLYNIYKIINQHNINIVHVYFPPETIIASILKRIIPNIKVIRSFEGNVKQGLMKKNIIYHSLMNFDFAIFISKYVRNYYSDKIPKRLLKKSRIIYNSASRINAVDKAIQHLAKNKKLVSVSGLNSSKNLFVLIDTLHILKKDGYELQLDILGDGPLKEDLQNKINFYNLQNNIHLRGFSNDVIQYLDNSSIFLHPADNEGFGIAVIEAMQRYCAIIVSNKGGLPEIITDNKDGLIADAYNAKEWACCIIRLINNQDLIDRLGKAAYITANNKFSIDKYVNSHENLYQNLI